MVDTLCVFTYLYTIWFFHPVLLTPRSTTGNNRPSGSGFGGSTLRPSGNSSTTRRNSGSGFGSGRSTAPRRSSGFGSRRR
ncbi:hypothetical protein [Nostoc sp. FACHB-133]|uniref:hypothetical protein n=1 Tax=Nostoc sp. FACHB-133 TaxID=2692835 RepID=UPI001689B6D8|nr:hypothetical protein [Nostoc sp. FACHB-133]MBD2526885.1 hypothetical protein [Nostoc sp. FACHB-133]